MRFEEIRLERYGHFEDRTVALGSRCSVVHGPNEAGKSTLLNALGDFLWGYSSRNHPRAFNYAPAKMRITGTVTEAGREHTWVRRLKKLSDSDGTDVVPPWDPQEGGSIKDWRQGFGLDLDHLQQGGKDLIAGGGDLADVVFLAEVGVAISRIRRKLEKRMDDVYKDRANARCEVRTALNRIEELSTQIRQSEASAVEIVKLRDSRKELERRKSGKEEVSLALGREVRRLEELGRCAGKAAELRETETELSDTRNSGTTLTQEETSKLEANLESQAGAEDAAAHDRLQLAGLEDEKSKLELRPQVTKQTDSIKDLEHRIAAVKDYLALLKDVSKNDSLRTNVRGLLHKLGVEPEGEFDLYVTELRIAADQRDQLDRVAQQLGDAQKELRSQRERVRKAADALRVREDSTGETGHDSALADARSRRDWSWSQIKQPWLSGDHPASEERVEMARILEADIRGADQVAESQAEQLTQAAEARGQILAREQELIQRRSDLAEAQDAVDTSSKLWTELVDENGLAKMLDPQAWSVRARVLDGLEVAWKEFEQHTAEREKAQRLVDKFNTQAEQLVGLLDDEEEDPLRRVEALAELLSVASSAEKVGKRIESELAKLRAHLAEQERTSKRAAGEIDRITTKHNDEAAELLERSQKALQLAERHGDLTNDLKAMKNSESDLQELIEEAVGLDEVARSARVDALGGEVKAAKSEVDELQAEVGSVNSELSELESRGSIVELTAERIAEGERLRGLVDEYRLLRLQVDMLDQYLEQAAEQSESPVLQAAGDLLSKLTFGRYVGFEIIADEDRRRIEIQHRDEPGEPTVLMGLGALSEGTADQAFLALRLAGIQARQAQRKADGLPTLPVVLDDVLVAHDDRRSAQALEVLDELSEEFQIILLTHHGSVLESAKQISGITAVELAQGEPTVE